MLGKVLGATLSIMMDERFGSKVYGRRNYIIVTYDKSFYKLGFGQAKRLRLTNWYLKTIAEHNIHFFEFTYKKDCESCAEALTENGYSQINLKF